MLNGKEDISQALIEAFLMEKGTREFYSHAAEIATDSAARTTFKNLTDWEQKHMDYIQFLYQSFQGERETRTFDEFINSTDAPFAEAGIPVKDLEARIEKYEIKDDMEALTVALELEGKAYNMYFSLSRRADDKNAQVVFKDMMEQELKHVDHLKKLRQKLIKVYNEVRK